MRGNKCAPSGASLDDHPISRRTKAAHVGAAVVPHPQQLPASSPSCTRLTQKPSSDEGKRGYGLSARRGKAAPVAKAGINRARRVASRHADRSSRIACDPSPDARAIRAGRMASRKGGVLVSSARKSGSGTSIGPTAGRRQAGKVSGTHRPSSRPARLTVDRLCEPADDQRSKQENERKGEQGHPKNNQQVVIHRRRCEFSVGAIVYPTT